ncbi:MAG: peptidyl-prolyl cis-trans isomerase [Leptospiraceae bacterium]|nr:peptidyl-prolyl cis-trans isomerase [Leptospiraceae bacterium]
MNRILLLLLAGLLGLMATATPAEERPRPASAERAPGETINGIRLIVGDEPITDLDIVQMEKNIQYIRKNLRISKRDAAIEELIERAIIERVARRESIIVSEGRIQTEIDNQMRARSIETEEEFQKLIQRETGMPFEVWKDTMRISLIRQQILQIMVSVPQPTPKEVEEFYRKNQRKIGMEFLYREIVFPYTSDISQERNISNKAKDIHQQLSSNPSSFATVARSLPENVSPYKFAGGLRNWEEIQNIAEEDRILAGVLYNMRSGQLSQVFRDQAGRYRIVYLQAKRPIPLDEVRALIERRLYYEQAEKAFDEWMKKQKETLTIQRL